MNLATIRWLETILVHASSMCATATEKQYKARLPNSLRRHRATQHVRCAQNSFGEP